MPQAPTNLREFSSLVAIVKSLRGPGGCPWDKEQTHQTLTRFALEETAELVEAIDSGLPEAICEELGDVLLQVVLHAQIAAEAGNFDIQDVTESISSKMIRRHPHVFADTKVDSATEVVNNWQHIKAKEKQGRPLSGGLPKTISSLIASQKIGEKTRAHRFDWTSIEDVFKKVEEEIAELKEALHSSSKQRQFDELGDVLFSLAQLARHLDGDAEQELRKTNQRFEKRFIKMLELLGSSGLNTQSASLEQLEQHWQMAKKELAE